MKKKILAMLLVGALSATMIPAYTFAGAVDVYADEEDEEDEEDEDMAEINIALMCFAPMDQSVTQPIEDAVNEIIEDEINVHANISW